MDMGENLMTLLKSLSPLTLFCRISRVSGFNISLYLWIDVSVDAHTKFTRAVEAARPIYEILHIAALAQEVS